MKVIADTGALYALMDTGDRWHQKTKAFIEKTHPELILPSPVIPEICYLANKYLGSHAEVQFLTSVARKELSIRNISEEQYEEILFYLEQYRDLNIGFVDASIAVTAESLNLLTIFTLDKRHFSAIKTKSGKRLTLVP